MPINPDDLEEKLEYCEECGSYIQPEYFDDIAEMCLECIAEAKHTEELQADYYASRL